MAKVKRTPTPYDVDLGKQLRKLRRQKGLTQQQLGEMLGYSYQQIQKYERGINRMRASDLVRLCKLLDMPLGTLLPVADTPYMYVLQEEYRLLNWWRKAPSPLQDAILFLAQKAAGLKSG